MNDVRQGHQILFCPYCSKIVFHTADDADLEDPGFSDSDEESLLDLVDDQISTVICLRKRNLTDLSDEDELTPEEAAEYAGDDDSEETDETAGDDDEVIGEDDDDNLIDDETEDDDDDESEDDFEEDEIDE